jgi:channel protein (hemolysin III family)
MNAYDGKGEYAPTEIEHIANILTHFIPSIVGLFTIPLVVVETYNNSLHILAALVYSACMVGVFMVSSSYHITSYLLEDHRVTKFLQKADHAIIFAFIASHYLPLLLMTEVGDTNLLGKWFLLLVVIIAIVGIVKIIFGWFEKIPAIPLYLTLGWIALLLLKPIANSDLAVLYLVEMIIGMLVYTCGVPLLVKFDGIIPFAHAVWHIFVTAAATIHFHSMFMYIISSNRASMQYFTMRELTSLIF